MKTYITLLFFSLFFFNPFILEVNAQNPKHKVINQIVELRGWPGGPTIGKVYPNAPIATTKIEKEEWVKIKIYGWVKKSQLKGSNKRNNKIYKPESTSSSPIDLINVNIKEAKRDILGHPSAIIFELRVKNVSRNTISSWSAILVIKDENDRILAKTLATHDDANLKPLEEGKVSFFWEKGDKEYQSLISTKKDNLKVTLHKVKKESAPRTEH